MGHHSLTSSGFKEIAWLCFLYFLLWFNHKIPFSSKLEEFLLLMANDPDEKDYFGLYLQPHEEDWID